MFRCMMVCVVMLMFVDVLHSHEGGHGLGEKVVVEAVEVGESGGVDMVSVDAKLSKVLHELDELKRQRRWQDVIGGVGYLVGLTGIMFYVMGKRSGEKG